MNRRHSACWTAILSCASIGLMGGCNGPDTAPQAVFLPRAEAENRVRANNALIDGRLRAKGGWAARVVVDDRTDSYDGRFKLYAIAPNRVVLELTVLGDVVFDVGCGETSCWAWQKSPADQEHLYAGSWEGIAKARTPFPLRPEFLIDALGMPRLEPGTLGHQGVYRVAEEAHQLLFVGTDDTSQQFIEREVWMDRYEPHLVRRVVYRDQDGRVAADIALNDHKPIPPRGALFAHSIEATFPIEGSSLKLDLNDWTNVSPKLASRLLIDPRERPKATLPPAHRITILD